MGKGQIILLGTVPDPDHLVGIISEAGSSELGPYFEASSNVLVVPRKGNGMEGAVVIELKNEPGKIELPCSYKDLLTGQSLKGELDVPGYTVMVLQKES